MRSSRQVRTRRGDPPQYPTEWSDWKWSDQFQCYERYRLKGPEDYEWDYGQVQSSSIPRNQPSLDLSQPSPNQYPDQNEEHYTTAPPGTSTSVEDITQGLGQTTLGSSSGSIQQPTFRSPWPTPSVPNPSNYITTRNPSVDRESFDPHYKVHAAWEFKWGRVFKVLWAEPRGDGGEGSAGSGTVSVRKNKHGESFHAKVRRFVIIAVHDGHCICLPIMTYSGQGVKKKGVHAEHHTIIYTEKPVPARGEKDRGLTKKPIKVIPQSPRHKLDNFSRLNYAKTYTVEYNVKVWFIGKVDKGSELQLKTDYNRTHPPLDTRSVGASFEDDTIHEEEDGQNDSGTGYSTFNQNTYSASTGTFPGSSSVPTSYGYQQAGSYQQGGTFQQSGTQTWNRSQDPYPMSRSTSQPGYYVQPPYNTGSSTGQQWSSQNHPSASGDSVPLEPEDYEGDRHRRGSIHSSEHHSNFGQGEAQEALVEEEELEEETETEAETERHQQPHYDPAPEDEHHGAQEYHEDIYDP